MGCVQDHQSAEHRAMAERISQWEARQYGPRHPGARGSDAAAAKLLPGKSPASGDAGHRQIAHRRQMNEASHPAVADGAVIEHRASKPSDGFTRARLRTPKAAAIAGLLFSVLLVAIMLLFRFSIPAHPQDPGAWLSG